MQHLFYLNVCSFVLNVYYSNQYLVVWHQNVWERGRSWWQQLRTRWTWCFRQPDLRRPEAKANTLQVIAQRMENGCWGYLSPSIATCFGGPYGASMCQHIAVRSRRMWNTRRWMPLQDVCTMTNERLWLSWNLRQTTFAHWGATCPMCFSFCPSTVGCAVSRHSRVWGTKMFWSTKTSQRRPRWNPRWNTIGFGWFLVFWKAAWTKRVSRLALLACVDLLAGRPRRGLSSQHGFKTLHERP